MTHEQLAAMAKHFFYVFPKLVSGAKIPRHIKFIGEKIQAAIEKKSDKNRMLIISVSPRHGKSFLISKHLPAWYLGKYPKNRIILTSYSSELSDQHSDYAKNIFAKWGPSLFDVKPSKTTFNRSSWDTEHGGGCISAGVGGSITGFGADCVFPDTLIKTITCDTKISELKVGDKVLSYNNDKLCYNKVLAIKKRKTREIYEITIGENKIKATGNHRFFICGQGYVQAKNLQEGLRTISVKQDMQKMRKLQKWSRSILQKMLYGNEKIRSRSYLRLLWEEIQKKFVRYKKSKEKWEKIYILFNEMRSRALSYKIWEKMFGLQFACPEKNYEVLFSGMQRKYKKENNKKVQNLLKRIYSKSKNIGILLSNMCEQGPLEKNDGRKKFKLSSRRMLSYLISKNKKNSDGKRQIFLSCLWNRRKISGTSFRFKQIQQQIKQFSDRLLYVPCNNTSLKEESVSRIRKINIDEQSVYDIQVENASNFFANNVLVHNCLIIDDYCKGHEEAESKTQKEKLWHWWKAVASSRLHPNSVVILICTRWAADDMSGRLIQQYKEEGDEFPFEFEHINLPAIAEEDDPLGRKSGEALWPERFSAKMLMNVKKTAGPFVWASLWQGNPRARGGNLFKSMYFRYWTLDWITNSYVCHLPDQDPMIIPSKDLRRIVIVDPALEIKTRNDPSGMLAWGYSKKYKVWLLLDALKGKIKHEILHDTILNFAFRNKCSEIFVENEKIGKILIKQSSGRDKMNGISIPFKEVKTKNKDKFSRCIPMASYTENGRVFFKKDAPWLEEYESDLTVFPDSDDDCWADCTGHASILEKSISVAEALARAMKLK